MKMWDFEKHKEKIAIITEEEKITYDDLNNFQRKFANCISNRSLICILAENNFESLICYVFCIFNNHVPIMAPVAEGEQIILEIVNRYRPNYIWSSKKLLQLFNVENYKEQFSFSNYVLLSDCGQKNVAMHRDLALLLHTSGSTGNPKLVRLSRENIIFNTEAICQYLKLTDHDRAVMSLPINYTYGLSIVNTIFLVGGSILLTKEKIFQQRFWDLMYKHEITLLPGVPYTYECLQKIRMDTFYLPKLRILTQAGGRLSEEQQYYWGKYAKTTGKQFYIMYGQTEATARISYLPAEDCLRKMGSVGIGIPGSRIYIEEEDKEISKEIKRQGEIVCVGKHVSMGYAEMRQDLLLPDMNKGILHTGDLGYLDEEGYLYIVGRKNRFAKIYGRRINLLQIETMAKKIIGGDVVAISNDKKIFLYTDAKVCPKQIDKLQENISFSINSFVVREMKELPRKENGKIKYLI